VKRMLVFFVLGSAGYPVLEILWRGHTHWSMALAGGVCFSLISLTASCFRRLPLPWRAAVCALGVTAVELVFGVVFNLLLGMNVWDYSDRLFHLWGQICPLFTLLWWLLSLLLLPLTDRLNRLINRGLRGGEVWM